MADDADSENRAVIKVLFVDDQPDLGQLIGAVIDNEPDMQITRVLRRAADVLEEIERTPPDVVLIDLSMPGEKPLSVIQEASRRFPGSRLVAFSAYNDQESIEMAAAAGAAGYICKTADLPTILAGIRGAAKGETVRVTD